MLWLSGSQNRLRSVLYTGASEYLFYPNVYVLWIYFQIILVSVHSYHAFC